MSVVQHIDLATVVVGGAGNITGATLTAKTAAALRVTVQLTTSVTFGAKRTPFNGTELAEGFFNGVAALAATGLYTFTLGVSRGDVVQFTVGGAATVTQLVVDEVKDGVI